MLSLSKPDRDAVRAAWRDRSPTTHGEASALARGWSPETGVDVPGWGEPGWTPAGEMLAQRALDLLLGTCHPDLGAGLPPPLPDGTRPLPEVVDTALRKSYGGSGWWLRTEDALVAPRRRGPHGALFDEEALGPLLYACCLTGEGVELATLVKLPEMDESDVPTPVGGRDCAVAPVIGAADLEIAFEKPDDHERWTYRAVLDSTRVDGDTLHELLDRAGAAGARILVCPEYALDRPLLERWKDALATYDWRGAESRLEWVLAGSGPVDAEGSSNVAVLLDRMGREVLRQPKTQAFDLAPDAWSDGWCCPTYCDGPRTAGANERLDPRHCWSLLETRAGRIAVAVCEALRPTLSSDSLLAVGKLRPTVVLSPVFGKPAGESQWERPASMAWVEAGADVVVANSVVVDQWRVDAGQSADPPDTSLCAAWRTVERPAHGKSGWVLSGVPRRATKGRLPVVATYAEGEKRQQ